MDDLLREFLTDTNERLDVVDVELVRFEQDPNKLDDTTSEPNPVNLDARLAWVSAGIHRLERQLLVILDVDLVLDIGHEATAECAAAAA
jgi:hypothetical protein